MVRRDQEAQTVSSNICIPGRGDYRDGSQRVGHHCMSLSISHEEGHAWHSCWYISYFFLDCCLCSRLACDLIWEKTYLYFHLSSFWLQILGESYPAPITHDLLVLWRSNSWAVHILREKVFYWEWILDWLWQTRMNVSWKSQLLRILFYSSLSRQRNKSYTHIPPHTTTAGSFLFFVSFIFISWRLITLQYCSGFAIHWHESSMDLHVFPIPIPPPTSLPITSLWVFPVHQPWSLVSSIQTGLVICFTLDSILVSMLFSQNTHPRLLHRVPKSVLYICVSFSVLHIVLLLPSF